MTGYGYDDWRAVHKLYMSDEDVPSVSKVVAGSELVGQRYVDIAVLAAQLLGEAWE